MFEVQLTIRIPQEVNRRLDTFVISNPEWSKSAVALAALDRFLPADPSRPRISGRAAPGAGQDAETGKAGRDFGMLAGRKIAEHYGKLVSPIAAKLILSDGRRATVRTAKGRNTQWGCLDSVREDVDVIYCAYAKDGETFQVWEVLRKDWERKSRPVSTGHKLHGKLTLVSKSDMQEIGREVDSALRPFAS